MFLCAGWLDLGERDDAHGATWQRWAPATVAAAFGGDPRAPRGHSLTFVNYATLLQIWESHNHDANNKRKEEILSFLRDLTNTFDDSSGGVHFHNDEAAHGETTSVLYIRRGVCSVESLPSFDQDPRG